MDVILKSNVDGLGQRGDVVSVANGYFRNYLLPKGLAYKASAGAEREAEAMRKASAARNAESRADADLIATQLVPQVIAISARADESGSLFGSVSAADISAAVEEQTGIALDRKALQLDSPIKATGTHMVMAKIHPDVQFPVSIEVSPED